MGGVINAVKDVGKAIGGGFLLGKPSGLSALINPAGALGLLGRKLISKPDPIRQEVGRLNDVSVQSSAYGTPIPIVLAPWRRAGEIIWSTPKRQSAQTATETVSGGKGGLFGGGEQQVQTTTYTYSVSMAIAFADARDGAIAGIPMFWANGELIYNISSSASYETYISSVGKVKAIRTYTGSLTQPVDPLIQAVEGIAPAYRSLAFSVFEDLQLEAWNNGVPNIEALVVPAGSFGITTPYLDAAGTFDAPFNASYVNFSIMNDGMLALVMADGIGNRQFSIRNPFTLATVEVLPDIGGGGQLQYSGVRVNQNGDMCIGNTYRKRGGVDVAVGVDLHTQCGMDLDGRFYVACRYQVSPYRPALVIIQLDGAFRVIDLPTSYTPLDLWYGFNGYVYVSTTAGSSTPGPLFKIDVASGAIVKTSSVSVICRRFVVAADDSVYFTEGDSVLWYRMAADWASKTLIFTYGLASSYTFLEGWGRNWETGGAIAGFHSEYRSYAPDGTLLESLPFGQATGAVNIITHPNFPGRVYYADTRPVGGIGNQFVTVVRKSMAGQSVLLASAITKLCARAGMQAGEYSAASLTDVLGGYAITQTSVGAALEPLLDAFNLQVQDVGTQLQFIKRGLPPVLTIPEDDLRMESQDDFTPVETEDSEESELPLEVVVRYRDTSRNYLADSQYDRRLAGGSLNRVTVDYQIGMAPTQARQLAASKLYDKWIARKARRWALDRKYARLVPGDTVNLPVRGVTRQVLIEKIRDEGALRICEGRDDEAALFTQTAAGNSGSSQSTAVGSVSPTVAHLLDVPLLRDSDDDYGIYAAAAGALSSWSGARLYKSTDAGVTYADAGATFVTASAIGTANTVLGNFAGGNIVDELSFLDVTLGSGTMASITVDQMLADTDDILIGNEVVACRSRLLIAANTYRCSGLLRGRYGTDWAMGQHVAGERVIVMSSGNVKNLALSAVEVGVARYYKAVSFGAVLQLATPLQLTYQGERLKPRAPGYVGGGRNAAGDITIHWLRAARRSTAWANGIDVPLDESSEAYRVRVFAGTALAVAGITKAINAELTVIGSPLPTVGDWVFLHTIGGMVQLNERSFQVVAITAANKFTINEDSTNWGPWTSGGSVLKEKASGAIDVTAPTASYTGAQQTTDFGALQAPVRVSVRQISSRVGEGRERTAIV